MSISIEGRAATRLQVETLASHFPRFARQFGDRAIVLLRADMVGNSGAFKEYGVREVVEELKQQGHVSVSTSSMGSQMLAVVSAAAEHHMCAEISATHLLPAEKEARAWAIWEQYGRSPDKLRIYKTGIAFEEAVVFGDQHFDPTTFIHPFNDARLLAHREQIFHDAIYSYPEVQHVVSPSGGASLSAALARAALDTHVLTYVSEALGSNSLSNSLRAREVTAADSPNPKYGGSAVRYMGSLAFDIFSNVPNMLSRIVTAPEHTVGQLAREYAANEPEVPMEPTALVAVAGLEALARDIPEDEPIGVIVTGHNESYTKLLAA
ncbi:pyridoxal-phosphate dependent enzyme [Candidatus Saccharibacteria bacterium]|nr:MAG: pyridoxal-phosphate dependent enzyme [Candidatus Saccharibacteria bacterium]